jgi:hypothetical protein
MKEFMLNMDSHRFRVTNASWNKLGLNDPWSIGYVTTLIESKPFLFKEEWECFYYESGIERQQLIAQLAPQWQLALHDVSLKNTTPKLFSGLQKNIKNLNFYYGRTPEELAEKGKILYDYMQSLGTTISIEECVECVRFRTICETWNGIIIREKNTILTLRQRLPTVEFIKTKGAFDYQFAVDYELKLGDTIVCGIQIKPQSYAYNTPYILKAKYANTQKNKAYSAQYHRPVFDIIASSNGEIINPLVLSAIHDLLKL